MNTQKSWKWTHLIAAVLAATTLLVGCGKKEAHSEHDGHGHGPGGHTEEAKTPSGK